MANVGKILSEPSRESRDAAKGFFGEARTIRFIDFRGDPVMNRKPDYYIYVFNTVPRKFEIRRPPNFPCIQFSGCPAGEPYALVGRFPNVIHEQVENIETGQVSIVSTYGERFVTDLLNPMNLSNDCWATPPQADSWIDAGGTTDTVRRGLFWSLREIPSKEELDKSRARVEAHYKSLLQQADLLYNEPQKRQDIGVEHHMAATFFNYRAPWHIVAEAPVTCPNCGDAIRAGVAFHVNALGSRCILDWKRAVGAGIVKKEDVPEEHQW